MRHPIDILLQLAFLEGVISTHGAYEMALRRRPVSVDPDAVPDRALEDRLVAALVSPGAPGRVTVGTVVEQLRKRRGMDPREFGKTLGLSASMVHLLERDRISPLKLPLAFWRTLRAVLEIDIVEFSEMIRRTHRLVFFGPALRGTLARRRKHERKNDARGGDALEEAARELLTRAELPLPPAEEARLQELLESLDGTRQDPA